MNGYTIGQISKIVQMPVVTLRYLEKQGLISPKRNEDNGYRLFSMDDIQKLVDYRWYRNAGYSQADAIETLKGVDFFRLSSRMEKAAQEARQEALHKQLLANRLSSYSEKLQMDNLINSLDSFTLMHSPEMYYCITAVASEKINRFKNANQLAEWVAIATDYYSFLDYVALVFLDDVRSDQALIGATYGFAMETHWAHELGIQLPANTIVIPAAESVNVMLRVPDSQQEDSVVREKIVPYIKDSGLELMGDIWGNRLAVINEGLGTGSYYEFWAPVRTGS